MTEHDPVDAVIAAYHDYLENGGTEPSLDHLDEDQRREAAELIDLIKDVRGVDFYRSAPSLDTLLAGTDLAQVYAEMHGVPVHDERGTRPTTAETADQRLDRLNDEMLAQARQDDRRTTAVYQRPRDVPGSEAWVEAQANG